MSKIETSKLSRAAVAKFQDLQSKLTPLLNRRLAFNVEEGRALYLSEDGELLEIHFVPVSSYGVRSGTTQWAWANGALHLPEAYGETMFRQLADKTGFRELQAAEPISLSEQEARCLLALLVDHVEGRGLLSEQCGDTIWSFVVTDLTRNSELTISEDSIRQVLYQLLGGDAVGEFNKLRARHPKLILDLSRSDLRGNPQPWKGDLHAQLLFDRSYLSEHQRRILDGINLSGCRLDESILRGVSLRNASLERSVLVNADFCRADLTGANMQKAFLNGANFCGAHLNGVHFAEAELGRTLFVDVDLSSATGLGNAHHSTTSEISFSTLVKSSFKLSEQFMRSAGVSMGLLDDLRRGQRFGTTYSTCFLSYSTKDSEFAKQLYYALIEAGVRVYWDHTQLTPGEHLDEQLIRAICEYDRTIPILSENSIQSSWVEREIKNALYYKPNGLTPIRLCDIPTVRSFVIKKDVKPDIVDTYPILDFSGWREPSEFARCRDLLLKSMRR